MVWDACVSNNVNIYELCLLFIPSQKATIFLNVHHRHSGFIYSHEEETVLTNVQKNNQ
jgi:hypothetical protein